METCNVADHECFDYVDCSTYAGVDLKHIAENAVAVAEQTPATKGGDMMTRRAQRILKAGRYKAPVSADEHVLSHCVPQLIADPAWTPTG